MKGVGDTTLDRTVRIISLMRRHLRSIVAKAMGGVAWPVIIQGIFQETRRPV